MKIAYLFSRYPVPSQTFCDTEIRALEAVGHEIEIYSCSAPTTSFRHGGPTDWPRAPVLYAPPQPVLDAWAEAAQRDGTWPASTIADHEARFGPRYDPARRARHALYFADRLRRRGVEHLHVHFANRATHAALFIHELTGVPFSFTAHAQDFLVDLGHDDLLRLLCDRAAFVVAVSDWSRRALVDKCPAAEPKIHRVYNGVALDRWPLSPSAVPLSPQADPDLRIFSIGRLIEFKGFQDLIAACRLLKERQVPFSCEIAGEGPLREALERQAAEFSGPRAQVRLAGLLSQEAIRDRMQACDVFVLACRVDEQGACDVLPTVILEAMASAKPVISTPVAAVPEMVDHDRTGLLVPPGNPVLLADSLAALAADAPRRSRLGSAGRAKAGERFAADESARQLSALFAGTNPAKAFGAEKPTNEGSRTGVICIFERWPLPSASGESPVFDDANLREFQRAFPAASCLALGTGSFGTAAGAQPPGASSETLAQFDFLPDAVVLETDWRKHPSLSHEMESWRKEAGGTCGTDEFLLACRRALYLHNTLFAGWGRPRHLHAVGPAAALCVWLLLRLGVSESGSFVLPGQVGGGTGMAGSTLRKLAPRFAGGWVVGERKLATSLGVDFHGEAFEGAAWLRALSKWF